jgi:hypothetical protein
MLKKKWKKPELIVLVRGKPEEAILAACKGGSFSSYSSTSQRGNCLQRGCGDCTNVAAS